MRGTSPCFSTSLWIEFFSTSPSVNSLQIPRTQSWYNGVVIFTCWLVFLEFVAPSYDFLIVSETLWYWMLRLTAGFCVLSFGNDHVETSLPRSYRLPLCDAGCRGGWFVSEVVDCCDARVGNTRVLACRCYDRNVLWMCHCRCLIFVPEDLWVCVHGHSMVSDWSLIIHLTSLFCSAVSVLDCMICTNPFQESFTQQHAVA